MLTGEEDTVALGLGIGEAAATAATNFGTVITTMLCFRSICI